MTISFEDQLRQDLHAAVGGASFDAVNAFEPASVISLGRRAVRRRRVTYAAGLAALAAVAVVAGLALGDAGPRRAETPPATSSTSGRTSNPGDFGVATELQPGGRDGDDAASAVIYSVRATDEGGRRSVVVTQIANIDGSVNLPVTTLSLDDPDSSVDIFLDNGALAALVTPESLPVVRYGPDGRTLQRVSSVRIPGTDRWLTVGTLPETALGPWEDLYWTSKAGTNGRSPAPDSATAVVPEHGGAKGWAKIPVRFTARPSSEGARVDVEKLTGASGMTMAGELILPSATEQVFVRGDGANYSAIYGLTRDKPVSVTPHGDTAARFADGWAFTTVEVLDGLWATAIQLSGMDDSSIGVLSLAWKDSTGRSHPFELP